MRTPPILAGALAAVLVLPCLPRAGTAHVTVDPVTAPAGGYARVALRVPHGCAGAATTSIALELPPGIYTAKPQPKPGWRLGIERRTLAEAARSPHGREVEEEFARVTWAGGPLADAEYDEFVLLLQVPNAPGGTLVLPVVQGCEGGATERWAEVPRPGQDPHDLARPAPAIRLAATHPVAPAALPGIAQAVADGAAGDLGIAAPWTRAAGQGGTGAGFLAITNRGKVADRLVSASTPLARTTELHTHIRDGDIMRMRAVEAIDLPPGQTVTLAPGAVHIMMIGLTRPLAVGELVPLTLRFAGAGEIRVELPVMAAGARGPRLP